MTSTATAMALANSRPHSPARAAAHDIAALSSGVVAFGLLLGVTVGTVQSGSLAAVLGAALVFGGSAQLTTVTVLHLGSELAAAVVFGAVVNARIMLYGAALESWFRRQPLWFRLLAPHFIQDQTYLSAVERPELRGAKFRRYWCCAGSLLLFVWTGAVVLGLVLARCYRLCRTWPWWGPRCLCRCWCPSSSIALPWPPLRRPPALP